MSAAQIRAEINALIASKFAEGTVDQYFLQLYVMWRYQKIRKGMVVEVIERYLHDADKILTAITVLLNQPLLDYDKVEGIADQLEGCSSSR
ncbi:histidine-containing phosphotransfer protein 2-like [Triticum dicoccoides]|uniref:histidine-containing phosphotransfer protein 2-like n=1 Tax=Triticum dicoccoides TaxID=85692 RepID=UPI0018900668|nr:histidine-containing phosphotransfer protein 2-like [Triticum dicoccoides]